MTLEWVPVPAGVLWQGTPAGEVDEVFERHRDLDRYALGSGQSWRVERSWFAKEAPRHRVEVPAFLMSLLPVTEAEFRLFRPRHRVLNGPDHPAVVSHAAAQAYCGWLTERLGRPVRLPSETEWERAARGDDTREYPWGDTFDAGRANLAEGAAGRTLPVGSWPSGTSPFGVQDLVGNVDEWTSSRYAPYPGRGRTCRRARRGRWIRT